MIHAAIAGLCALALAYPDALPGRRVHDFADILPPQLEQQLERDARGMEAATTAEFAIVTVASLEGQSVEEYANALFNQWGIGKAGRNNGVLLLVAPRDRRARIEVGYGLEPVLPDGLCGEILDIHAIPAFRTGDYDAGIAASASAITTRLRQSPEEARGFESSAPGYLRGKRGLAWGSGIFAAMAAFGQLILGWWMRRRENYPPFAFLSGTALAAGAGIAMGGVSVTGLQSAGMPWPLIAGSGGLVAWSLISNARSFLRFGPHACRACGTRLSLLSESDDDASLTVEQKLEEELGSVDYDVWICPRCLKYETKSYVALWSGFIACPRCSRRTMKETDTTLRAATTSSSGEKRVDGHCASCKHQTTRYVTIPRISTSSGGHSGGGFGGGSSGGGGASRGW